MNERWRSTERWLSGWQRGLLRRHPEALLNREGLRGGAGSAAADVWYYDPASDEHAP